MLQPAELTCPWCWQQNSLSVDCSAGDAQFVEDCTVCCRPMSIRTFVGNDGGLEGIEVTREND